MAYHIAMCGVSANDQHLLEVVVTRTPKRRHGFRVLQGTDDAAADIAIVDVASPDAEAQFRACLARNPALVAIDLSDHGLQGRSRYRIERHSLLVRVLRVLEDVVEREFKGRPPRSPAPGALPD